MLNSGFRGTRASDGTGAISAQTQSVQAIYPIPKIIGWAVADGSYVATDDTAVGSGSTVVIYGNNFTLGMTVYIGASLVSATYIDSSRIAFIAPTLSNGTYAIYITTPQGAAAILSPGIIYSGFPTWLVSSYNSSVSTLNIQLIATGDVPLTYTLQNGSVLPPGISLTSTGILTGTTSFTVDSVYNFTVIVTDAQLQNVQQLITLSFVFGDSNWKYTSLLLNGETSVTPFINDASTNNLALVIQGDTKPTTFTPYSEGYYSNFFDGTGDYLTLPNSSSFAFGTGDFTIEFWINTIDTAGGLVEQAQSGGWSILIAASTIYWQSSRNVTNLWNFTAASIINGVWHHLAFSRFSGSTRFFIDGVLVATNADGTNYTATAGNIQIGRDANPADLVGYISNLRIIKGTGLYTSAFTPSTIPLTTTSQGATASQVSLLTCQSNRLIDNSNNNFIITKNGDTAVSSTYPFATPTTALYNSSYSAYFDGTGDYLTIANSGQFQFPGDFTIEGWMYFTNIAGGSPQALFSVKSGGTEFDIRWFTSRWQISLNAGSGTDIGTTPAPVNNSWTHVAAVRSGSSVVLYINGVATGTILTNSSTLGQVSSAGSVAASNTGGNIFTGYISNLRIVKGTAVYTTNFTPSTLPLTEIANTVLLTCQSATFVDNSANNYTITSLGQAQPVALSPFTMTTGTNTLTSLGSTYFDGSGDHLTLPALSNFTFGTGNFSIEFWVYPTVNARQDWLDFTDGTNRMLIYYDGTNIVYYILPTTNNAITGSAPVFNSWNHIAISRSSGSTRMFINGVQSGSTYTDAKSYPIVNLTIGKDNAGSTHITGYMSNIRIIKGSTPYTSNFLPPQTPLTSVTNTSLLTLQYSGGANNSSFIDNSNFNNIITRFGNTSQGTFSPYSQTGWSNYFDGTGDYLEVSSTTAFDQDTDFTVELWLNISSYPGSNDAKVYQPNGSGSLAIGISTTGKINIDDQQTGNRIVSVLTLARGIWYHIALVRNGPTTNNLTLYINGSIDTTVSYSNWQVNPTLVTIGRRTDTNTGYTGYISNLRVVKGTAVYTSSFIPSTTPLTVIANTVLLTCQSNRLIDNSINSLAITRNGDASVQAVSPFGSVREVTSISYSNYFDGNGDYLSIPDNTALDLATGGGITAPFTGAPSFTVECWFYCTALTATDQDIINKDGTAGSSYTQYGFQITSAGLLRLVLGHGENASTGNGTQQLFTILNSITLNTWYHVAACQATPNQIYTFLNGTLIATTTRTQYMANGPGKPLLIGYQTGQAATQYFNGYVSNVRIIKGTALYTSTFTPSTTPLTAISNTSLLTCQSTTMIDNSTNRFTITANGNVTPRIFNPFGYTAQSATNYTPSIHGGSAYFDGTGDYLVCPAIANISGTGYSWTVQGWFYPRAVDGTRGIIDGWNGGSGASLLVRINAGYLECYVTGGSNTQTAAAVIDINQWYHFALVKNVNNSNTVQLYLNGVKVGTPIANYTTAITSNIFGIGGNTSTGGEPFNGYLSDISITKGVAVYTSNFISPTYTLTSTPATTLLLNFNNGGIVDQHSTNVLETVGNAQLSTSVKKHNNSSIYFDGTGDYLSLQPGPNPNFAMGSGDWTIEMWMYPTSAAATQLFLDVYDGNSAGRLTLQLNTARTIGLYGASGAARTVSTGTVTLNQWNHVAFCKSSGSTRIFIDGTQVNTTYADSVNYTCTTGVIYIAANGTNAGNNFAGYLDDLRITKGFARYTANFSVPGLLPIQ
jgi:hypothetical protein